MKRCVLGLVVLVLTSYPVWAGPAEGPVAGAGGKMLLRLRLEDGKVYRIRQTLDQKIDQKVMGRKMSTEQTMGFVYSFKVKKVAADGAMTADLKYESVSFKMKGPVGEVAYDSANPPENIPPAALGHAALVGKGFSITFTRMGLVKKTEGIDKMIDGIFREAGVKGAGAKEALKAQWGDKAMKQTLEQMTAIYPDKPVGVGDVWKKEVNLAGMFGMKLDSTYKLTARKEGTAVVAVSTKITPVEGGKPMEIAGMKMTWKLTGTQKGTMRIDERTGWVKESDLAQDVSGTITMQMPGLDEPMVVPIELKSTIRLSADK